MKSNQCCGSKLMSGGATSEDSVENKGSEGQRSDGVESEVPSDYR